MRFSHRSRERSRRASLFSVALVALCWAVAPDGYADESDWRPTRFRVTLRGVQPVTWSGEITLSAGRLERFQAINNDPEAAAGASIEDGRLRLAYRKPLTREVFDLTANCPPETTLAVRLAIGEDEGSLSIDAARREPQSARIGRIDAEIRLDRIASDRVRIETDCETLLFDPGSSFDFTAIVDPPGADAEQPYDLSVTLARGRAGDTVWTGEPVRVEPRGRATRTPVTVPLPEREGVYRVTVAARRPNGFLDRFPSLQGIRGGGSEPVLLRRTFQVAVHDTATRPQRIGTWREVYAFDPREHGWADRLPDWMRWRRLPWFARGPLSSDGRSDLQAERDGAIEVTPATTAGLPWRAYPLPIDETGATYAVEVETLGDPGDRLTLAVLEPDALGDLRVLGSGVELIEPRWNQGAAGPHRLLIRPRSPAPLLIIANGDTQRPARFGTIRLLKAVGGDADPAAGGRVVALDWTDSDLPHAVGASHAAIRGSNHRPYEVPDLQTFYETAIAVADRVEAAGANAAVVPVNQNGAALYPSQVWASPFYDLGVWSDGAADLPRRELLTLIAREFRRRGLKVMPAMRFDAPTALLASPPEGRVPADDPVVTQVRAAALAEVLRAVGDPGVLAGVAIRTSPRGWCVLTDPQANPGVPERLAVGYKQLADYVADRTAGKPLVVLPAETVLGDRAAEELAPRLGEASQAAGEFVSRLGLRDLSAQGLLASPFGSPHGPLDALRRVEEASFGVPAFTLRSRRTPVRLIGSAAKLRDDAGQDVVIPTITIRPGAEAAVLARAVADGVPVVVLDGAGSSGVLTDSTRQARSLATRLPRQRSAQPLDKRDAQRDVSWKAWDGPDGESLATVTNRSAWKRVLRLTVDTPRRLRGTRLQTGAENPEWFEAGRHAVDLELAPFETAAWRFEGNGVTIEGVRLEPTPLAAEELARSLADLQTRDTTVRRRVELIRNASFEQPGTTSEASQAWTARGRVTRDLALASDGAASMRLVATPDRSAELISESFAAPTTGQLVAFVRTRAVELGEDAVLRVEVRQPDGPYRRSIRFGPEALRVVDADGWSPPAIFPLDDLPLIERGELELRVTLSGAAEVLVDEVVTEDLVLPLDGYGPIEKRVERFALVRLMTAGEKLLADGRLEACREVLDSYWARFLRDNFPLRAAEPIAAAETTTAEAVAGETAEDAPAEAKPPSMAERMRGYLPRWWR